MVDGKLRILNMRFCPYAQRAVLVALAKDLPYVFCLFIQFIRNLYTVCSY